MPNLYNFVPTLRHDPYPAIDPSKVKLPSPFTVVVIGASRGIGAGIAYSYARAGASTIILSSRRVSGLESVAQECRKLSPLGDSAVVEIVPCDVTDKDAVASLAQQVEQKFGGRLDVLVMNSGYAGDIHSDVVENPVDEFKMAMDVNYFGTFLAAKYFFPLLKKTDGPKAFIAVGSFAAAITKGVVASPQYCISKHAQARLVEMMDLQYQKDGLLIVDLHPGGVLTEMSTESKGAEQFREFLIDHADLCGCFSVWLTKEKGTRNWLSGRIVSVNWDVDELVAKKEEIVEKDLLKAKYADEPMPF